MQFGIDKGPKVKFAFPLAATDSSPERNGIKARNSYDGFRIWRFAIAYSF